MWILYPTVFAAYDPSELVSISYIILCTAVDVAAAGLLDL